MVDICFRTQAPAAIIVPPIAPLAVEIILGWLFFISGIVGLVMTFMMRHAPGFWRSLFSAALAIAAVAFLPRWPVRGALSLTLVLIAFFILAGLATILYATDLTR